MENTKQRRYILCIDDDPDDLQMLQEALSMIDGDTHQVIEANDGAEGLEKLRQLSSAGSSPCLVVLDINMPKLDGKQTFLSIKSDKQLSEIPIVVFSTSSSMLDKMFFQKKNTEFITKPIDFNRLVDVAKQMLTYCKHD